MNEKEYEKKTMELDIKQREINLELLKIELEFQKSEYEKMRRKTLGEKMIIPQDIKEENEKLLEKKLNHIMRNNKTIEGMEREDFKIRYAWALLFKDEVNSFTTECEKQ